MNVVIDSRRRAILYSVFPRTPPYQALSLLRAVATGDRGPFTEREVTIAANRVRKAGYSPDSLLSMLDIKRGEIA